LYNQFSRLKLVKVAVKIGWNEINGTHQLLAFNDDVNILGGSVHTIKDNKEAM
jgi:hypothetical protein